MFRNFRYVYTLYEEGSFTKAAEKLFISQPSLSAAIKKIEKEIGADLFERRGGGARLTEVGRAYIVATEKIIRAENQFKREVLDIQGLESGQVILGGSNYLSSYVLPKIINRFTALHPKITISLVEANSCNLVGLLDREQVDIVVDNIEPSDKYVRYPLLEEDILLCVPKENPVNQGLGKYQIAPKQIYAENVDIESIAPVPLRTFKNEKFILLKPENDMYYRAMGLFAEHHIDPNVAFSVDQLNISYALTDSGVGLSFMPDTFFKYGQFRESVVLYKVAERCSRTLYLAHLRDKYCSKVMNEFVAVAREVVK